MREELVSVIIPTFNRKNTITRCVDSVLNQTYRNIEVIVVDDGSTDDTESVFAGNSDPRVIYTKYGSNRGACYARNYGCSLAKGKYIAFQDSDDTWVPEKIEKELAYLIDTGADFVFCGMNRVNPMTGENYYYPEIHFDDRERVLEQLLTNNVISTQTMFLKKELMDVVQFDDSFKRYQDWDFALQAALNGFRIKYLASALVDSTVQANSISSTVKEGMAYEHLYEKYCSQFEKYPEAMASICSKMGHGFRKNDRKKTFGYFKKSLRYRFDMKLAMKIILYSVHLWS